VTGGGEGGREAGSFPVRKRGKKESTPSRKGILQKRTIHLPLEETTKKKEKREKAWVKEKKSFCLTSGRKKKEKEALFPVTNRRRGGGKGTRAAIAFP